MKFLCVLLLCLLCAPIALSQPKPIVQFKDNLGFLEWPESILWHKYLERENQLLLLSDKTLKLIDVAHAKVLVSRPVVLPNLNMRGGYDFSDWVISPDGHKMLIVGHPEAKAGAKQLAWVWDLEADKRVAVLDQAPSDIRSGVWSKNGRTLVTFDTHDFDSYITKLQISFWDGETFAYRNSISVDNLTWWYLSNDGQRFFAASGRAKNLLGVKYVSDASDGVINAWDTGTGQIEKTIAVSAGDFAPRTKKITVSPDERFLVFAQKNKANEAESRLIVWELNGSVAPKYEIKPQPKIDNSRVVFSPDGKYFALDVGKNLQIYETQTGTKRSELPNVELPYSWLNNQVLVNVDFKSKSFFEMGMKLEAFDAINGQMLYRHMLEYSESDEPDLINPNTSNTTVTDQTTIIPHPNGQMFLTYSNEYVKIFDARTGELLQTVIAPPIDYSKKKPKLKHGAAVLEAGWSNDGKTLYVFSANRQTVSLWGLLGS